MSGKHGQAIGGIKSQQRILRERIKLLEFKATLLIYSTFLFLGTLIIEYLVRHYG